jgi:hypothetical protein
MIPEPSDTIVWYFARRSDGRISLTVTASQEGITDKVQALCGSDTQWEHLIAMAMSRTSMLTQNMSDGELTLNAVDELEF